MHIEFANYKLRWLTEKRGATSVIGNDGTLDLVDALIPKQYGIATLSSENLTLGMTIFHGVHRFTSAASGVLIPLAEFESTYPENALAIQTAYGGVICHKESYPKKEVIYRPGQSLFRHANKVKLTALLDGSSNSEMIGVYIGDSALVMLLGEPTAELLFKGLNLDKAPAVEVRPVPPEISRILLAALENKLTGPTRKLYAQSKVLEYLGALVGSFSDADNNYLPLKLNLAEKIRQYLLAVDGRMPTLNELSIEFKLSARTLNQAYIKHYNQSIYVFMTEHRLMQAHAALESTQTPMKTISDNLGYSHVNHFITAFRNKFGYPPGSLRKK